MLAHCNGNKAKNWGGDNVYGKCLKTCLSWYSSGFYWHMIFLFLDVVDAKVEKEDLKIIGTFHFSNSIYLKKIQ